MVKTTTLGNNVTRQESLTVMQTLLRLIAYALVKTAGGVETTIHLPKIVIQEEASGRRGSSEKGMLILRIYH